MKPTSEQWMHKKAAEALERRDMLAYREVEQWLSLSPVEEDHESLADRFHLHLKAAHLARKEHNLLHITKHDTPSNTPYLPYVIYLDSLRSGFNVGNIVRTTESFRLGKLAFSSDTPPLTNKKVKDAAMGTDVHVHSVITDDLSILPRPLIAIETSSDAIPYTEYSFPEAATLLLGNEEYGLSKHSLEQADVVVSIPLHGWKNSLNVGNAFAILAAHISHTVRSTKS